MARRKKGDAVSGWICLDKPYDLGSTSAVTRVRRIFNAQKAGHAGTLDPLATGILPIALGEATKTVAFLMDADKSYRFTIAWGTTTASFDREGAVTATSDVRPTREGSSLPARISQSATITPSAMAETVRVPGFSRALSASTCRGTRTIGRPCLSLKASSVVTASSGMSSRAVSTGSRASKQRAL